MTRNITRPLTGLAAAAALFAFAAPALAESMLGDETEGTALVPISQNARYVVNPPLSAATIERRKKGYFTGPAYRPDWHVPNAKEVAARERRRAGRFIAQYNR